MCILFLFCKQKTADEVRISDWSSDVCSSDLKASAAESAAKAGFAGRAGAIRSAATNSFFSIHSLPYLSSRLGSCHRRDNPSIIFDTGYLDRQRDNGGEGVPTGRLRHGPTHTPDR